VTLSTVASATTGTTIACVTAPIGDAVPNTAAPDSLSPDAGAGAGARRRRWSYGRTGAEGEPREDPSTYHAE